MKTYYADIVLHISDFDAESKDDADMIVDKYIDILAKISEPFRLAWPEVDYTVTESVKPE